MQKWVLAGGSTQLATSSKLNASTLQVLDVRLPFDELALLNNYKSYLMRSLNLDSLEVCCSAKLVARALKSGFIICWFSFLVSQGQPIT
jgi:hypothetical protein